MKLILTKECVICKKTKARLEAEQGEIITQIQAVRREARHYSLRVQQTREVQDLKEAERRRKKVAQLQAPLMKVQAELGEVNRSLRAQKPQSACSRPRTGKTTIGATAL